MLVEDMHENLETNRLEKASRIILTLPEVVEGSLMEM